MAKFTNPFHRDDSTEIHEGGSHTVTRGLGEERSLMLTFLIFAIILALSALAILGLIAESGNGSLTSATTAIANGITTT